RKRSTREWPVFSQARQEWHLAMQRLCWLKTLARIGPSGEGLLSTWNFRRSSGNDRRIRFARVARKPRRTKRGRAVSESRTLSGALPGRRARGQFKTVTKNRHTSKSRKPIHDPGVILQVA